MKAQSNNKSDQKPKMKPIPAPRKNVKQMVQDYENIIEPPIEFRDKPVAAPRTKSQKPVPLPRTKIEQLNKALKDHTKSFKVTIKDNKDPLIQLTNPRKVIEILLKKQLN